MKRSMVATCEEGCIEGSVELNYDINLISEHIFVIVVASAQMINRTGWEAGGITYIN